MPSSARLPLLAVQPLACRGGPGGRGLPGRPGAGGCVPGRPRPAAPGPRETPESLLQYVLRQGGPPDRRLELRRAGRTAHISEDEGLRYIRQRP